MADSEQGSPPPTQAPEIQNPYPDDMIRIMLATDNHIGYMERDPIRGQDSINSFREVLQLAVKHDVDFVLLAGDLFHENKPSRDCLYKTIALLREYTMGDKPVQVELLSDPNDGKADGFSFPAVNYEDPNLNVGIPVFSIHGNHDDPQGAGSEGALCALDVLSVSGLINYMGKFDLPLTADADASKAGIAVKPVLLRKGNTLLGLYGIGNVKDQRMHFELRSNRVRMFMPRDKDSWFNILLLHQNRVKHGPQEFVPEGMFDDSVDLVVWGHEHDCRIVPEPVAGKNYYITQPGSSVATSLSEGESVPKHVALLSIQGKEFNLQPIALRTVRPFVVEDVVLSEEEDLDLTDQKQITNFLKSRVEALIEKAAAEWDERNAAALASGEDALPAMLPLVRLRVETTGASEMSNPVRFGQEFQGRIANPRDVLIFHRSKRGAARTKVALEQPELSIDDPSLSVSEKLEKVRVGTLVKEYLGAQEMQLLGEMGMSDAIQMFVEKDDNHAIQTHVSKELRDLLKGIKIDNRTEGELGDDDVEELLARAKEDHEREYEETSRSTKTSKGKGKARAEPEPAEESDDSMKMDVDVGHGASDFDEESDPPPKKRKAPAKKAAAPAKKAAAPAKKAPARGRGKKVATPDESDDDVEVIDLDDVSGSEDDEPPPPKKRTNRAATLSQPAAKKAPAKRKTAAASSKQTQLSFEPAATQRTSSRAAATKARGKIVIEDDDSD
ncbi:Metallo-dependent phosphatase-like protein [Schizophyllum amplum]|uniref:Double-strand break repair protein n=1 Tax=Schizophyllum amplum TaxID=97359 RepID=A0A550CQG4_9AGAR|nr:Metallo-dependent phosphatase-like protein [Auriculariopsis ampla]